MRAPAFSDRGLNHAPPLSRLTTRPAFVVARMTERLAFILSYIEATA
jgi:hypothetical protein